MGRGSHDRRRSEKLRVSRGGKPGRKSKRGGGRDVAVVDPTELQADHDMRLAFFDLRRLSPVSAGARQRPPARAANSNRRSARAAAGYAWPRLLFLAATLAAILLAALMQGGRS